MFENKIIKVVVQLYFLALLFMMHYFINETAFIGGVGISYRHLFALGIVLSSFCVFLIKPELCRAVVSVKSALVYSAPLLIMTLVSMLVWVLDRSSTDMIFRGISYAFVYSNLLTFALAAAFILYLFGENGIWLNLISILGANLLMIIQIIVNNGIGPFFDEFFRLLTSFADDTGEIIVQAEIHELSFVLGAYIIYMLVKPKKNVAFWILFGLAVFCFLAALKRIAFLGIALAFIIRFIIWITAHISKKAICRVSNIIMIVSCILLVAYIFVIKAGLFEYLEDSGIVDTNGRAEMYSIVSKYYEVTPSFVGNGIGFLIYTLDQLHIQNIVGISTVHNDFLQFYIDLGFFGYIFWLISMSFLRTKYFGRKEDSESAMISCMLIAYLFGTSVTDNTINYPLLTMTLAIIIIGHNYTARVEEEKERFETKMKNRLSV